jgi:hypothetical protein
MIEAEIENPAAAVAPAANRNSTEYLTGSVNIHEKHSIFADDFQSIFVAYRYNLEPHIARLICDLAGIGGAR